MLIYLHPLILYFAFYSTTKGGLVMGDMFWQNFYFWMYSFQDAYKVVSREIHQLLTSSMICLKNLIRFKTLTSMTIEAAMGTGN